MSISVEPLHTHGARLRAEGAPVLFGCFAWFPSQLGGRVLCHMLTYTQDLIRGPLVFLLLPTSHCGAILYIFRIFVTHNPVNI